MAAFSSQSVSLAREREQVGVFARCASLSKRWFLEACPFLGWVGEGIEEAKETESSLYWTWESATNRYMLPC